MPTLDIVPDGRTLTISWPEDMVLTFPNLGGEKIVINLSKRENTVGKVAAKPGPKPVSPEVKAAKMDSSLLHKTILHYLSQCHEASSSYIRAAVMKVHREADKNTIAWALVELQNEGCIRGKNRPKTGPIVKTATGYRLR